MHPQRVALLQAMPIFGAIHESTLDFLVGRARVHRVPAGTAFFREGDAATGMFVLEAGRVVVSRRRAGGESVIREFGAGECFGEMALMDLQPRSASVVALDDCRAFEIGPADLLELFERDVAQFALIQMNMGREVCRRLRVTADRLFALEAGLDAVPGTARCTGTG